MKASSRFFRRPTWIQTIAICLIVAAVCTLVTSSVLKSRYEAELGIYGNYSKLEEIRRLVKEYYVGEYTDEELMDMLAIGYMNGLTINGHITRPRKICGAYMIKSAGAMPASA